MARRPPFPDARTLPGSIVLREALRTLRHVAREGRNAVAEASRQAGPPVADLAGVTIKGIDQLAGAVEDVADRFFKDPGAGILTRGALAADEVDAQAVAAAAYSALRRIQHSLGIREAFISELKIRDAFVRVRDADPFARAAHLIVEMRLRGVIGDLRMEPRAAPRAEEAADLALFSLFLWALSDRHDGDAGTALEAAVVMALALRRDIQTAGDDAAALADLLSEFAPHV